MTAPSDLTNPTPGAPVLVVDDQPALCQTLRMILELEGHRVTIALDGATALAAAVQEPPAVVLLDVQMPGMDGYQTQAALHAQLPAVPVVFMTQNGGGIGAGAHHSQPVHPIFMNMPMIKVVTPSTPYDVKGLLKAAIRDDNPVLVLEHKALLSMKGPVPVGTETVAMPAGPRVLREGGDVTIVASLAMVGRSLAAADLLAGEGIGAEVIDIQVLRPLDVTPIAVSVRKTCRRIPGSICASRVSSPASSSSLTSRVRPWPSPAAVRSPSASCPARRRFPPRSPTRRCARAGPRCAPSPRRGAAASP